MVSLLHVEPLFLLMAFLNAAKHHGVKGDEWK